MAQLGQNLERLKDVLLLHPLELLYELTIGLEDTRTPKSRIFGLFKYLVQFNFQKDLKI